MAWHAREVYGFSAAVGCAPADGGERERALLLLVSVELDMLGDLVCKTVLNQWFSWRVPLKP